MMYTTPIKVNLVKVKVILMTKSYQYVSQNSKNDAEVCFFNTHLQLEGIKLFVVCAAMYKSKYKPGPGMYFAKYAFQVLRA